MSAEKFRKGPGGHVTNLSPLRSKHIFDFEPEVCTRCNYQPVLNTAVLISNLIVQISRQFKTKLEFQESFGYNYIAGTIDI